MIQKLDWEKITVSTYQVGKECRCKSLAIKLIYACRVYEDQVSPHFDSNLHDLPKKLEILFSNLCQKIHWFSLKRFFTKFYPSHSCSFSFSRLLLGGIFNFLTNSFYLSAMFPWNFMINWYPDPPLQHFWWRIPKTFFNKFFQYLLIFIFTDTIYLFLNTVISFLYQGNNV